MSDLSPLNRALALSDQILSAIESQKLDDVTSLDAERRKLIEQYYQQAAPIDEKLTRVLKQKNDEIVAKLAGMQHDTRSQQINLNKSKKVAKAYQSNA